MKKYLAVLLGMVLLAGAAVGSVGGQEKRPDERRTDGAGAQKKSDDGRKSDAATSAKLKTVTGVVKSTADDGIVLSGAEKGKDRDWAFSVDEKTSIKKGGKAVAPAELRTGDPVTVSYTEAAGKVLARTITVRDAPGQSKADGKGRPATKQ
jgi:hypothetical protein